jgi:hypothetical protein
LKPREPGTLSRLILEAKRDKPGISVEDAKAKLWKALSDK